MFLDTESPILLLRMRKTGHNKEGEKFQQSTKKDKPIFQSTFELKINSLSTVAALTYNHFKSRSVGGGLLI